MRVRNSQTVQVLEPEFLLKQIHRYVPKFLLMNFTQYHFMSSDIEADIFLKIMKTQYYDESKSKLSTYILNITRNHILDLIRHETKRREKGYIYITEQDNDLEEDLITTTDMVKLRTHINAIISNLSSKEVYILDNKLLGNMNSIEIKTNLQLTTTQYNNLYNRLIIKLRDVFENNEFVLDFIRNKNIRQNLPPLINKKSVSKKDQVQLTDVQTLKSDKNINTPIKDIVNNFKQIINNKSNSLEDSIIEEQDLLNLKSDRNKNIPIKDIIENFKQIKLNNIKQKKLDVISKLKN